MTGSRKLASVQIIQALSPIEKADRIEKARVMGWDVVVKKEEFSVGDKCIFFEVDSVLPEGVSWAKFLAPKKYRVKTTMLRGVLSQGLALPLRTVFSEKVSVSSGVFQEIEKDLEEGQDVTGLLRVTKYSPEVKYRQAEVVGGFPSYVPKTDEVRIQSALHLLDELKHPFHYTVKIDGCSATYHKLYGKFYVCSRSLELKDTDGSPYWEIARKYEIASWIRNGYAIQGEICGPKIQKNRLQLKELEFFIFDIFYVHENRYLTIMEMIDFVDAVNKEFGKQLKIAPLENTIGWGGPEEFDMSLDNFLELAKGYYSGTNNLREGIVVRSSKNDADGKRVSFKVLNNDFLLKE